MSLSPQSRDLSGLCPCIRTLYAGLIVQVQPHEIQNTTLIETLRQPDRQAYYVRVGASRTMHSMHLAQPPNGLALAFDLAPTAYLSERAWHPEGELWYVLGAAGEALGLEWGGRWSWRWRTSFRDMPHFQLRRCACVI